jgi:hypothetical protein
MEINIKKDNEQKWHNKRKLFDDSESDDQDEDDMVQTAPKIKENVGGMINKIINKPKEVKPASKIVEQIPSSITEILDRKAKELDGYIESIKREHEGCLKLERELTEGLNDNKRSKRLHIKNMKETEEEIEKQIE